MNRYRELLAIPEFRRLWIGSTGSALGDGATWIVLSWLVYQRTQSPGRDRSGVGDPHIIGPRVGCVGQGADAVDQLRSGGAQPLVVAGLAGQVGEQVPQAGAGIAQPASFRGVSQQGLHDCHGQQLRVGQHVLDVLV
jgi:hypothetical protein